MAATKVPFRREVTGTAQGDRAQLLAIEHQRQAEKNPLANARLIDAEDGAAPGSGLSFAAGVVRSIPHGLGRAAIGFIEVYGVDTPVAARVGLFPSAHPATVSSKTHITVSPVSTSTCMIVVF